MSRIKLFENYIHKVFYFETLLSGLQDNRCDPDIDICQIVKALIYGSSLRIRAISEIETECREGFLKKRVGPISDDSFGYGLNHLETHSLQEGWEMMVIRMKRNGMIRNSQFKGWIVGVFDGIETLASYSRNCDRCHERKITFKDGTTKLQYYHRMVVLSLLGYKFPIPIGMEFMRKGEGEVECALRLLKRIVKNLGVRFLDMVIGDALYCTPHFFQTCQQLGVEAGAVVKDNQEGLLCEAEFWKNMSKPVLTQKTKKEKLKLWDLPKALWRTANRNVRIIWAERKTLVTEELGKVRSKKWMSKRNVYVFSKGATDELDSQTLYQIGRHRWDIDASLFMDLTVNSFLKHPTLHFEYAYENLQAIRLISYFLIMFFMYNHILSRQKNKNVPIVYMVKKLYVSISNTNYPFSGKP